MSHAISDSQDLHTQPVYRFGTFLGVYTPSILTILGVMMYLRFFPYPPLESSPALRGKDLMPEYFSANVDPMRFNESDRAEKQSLDITEKSQV